LWRVWGPSPNCFINWDSAAHTRTNLGYANKHRDWRLFQALPKSSCAGRRFGIRSDCPDPDLPNLVFVLDSSIISLVLNLFPWGYMRAAVSRPQAAFNAVFKGQCPGLGRGDWSPSGRFTPVDKFPFIPGATIVMDRGYMDFVRLYGCTKKGVGRRALQSPVSFKSCNAAQWINRWL